MTSCEIIKLFKFKATAALVVISTVAEPVVVLTFLATVTVAKLPAMFVTAEPPMFVMVAAVAPFLTNMSYVKALALLAALEEEMAYPTINVVALTEFANVLVADIAALSLVVVVVPIVDLLAVVVIETV